MNDYKSILNILFQSPVGDNNEKEQEEAASLPIGAETVISDFESLAAKTEDERAEDTELDIFLTRLHH